MSHWWTKKWLENRKIFRNKPETNLFFKSWHPYTGRMSSENSWKIQIERNLNSWNKSLPFKMRAINDITIDILILFNNKTSYPYKFFNEPSKFLFFITACKSQSNPTLEYVLEYYKFIHIIYLPANPCTVTRIM